VLWNIAKVSNSLDAYLQAENFVINVLSDDQKILSSHFARSDHTLFDNVDYSNADNGAPLLPGNLATFECRTRDIHDSGDHHIIIGEVTRFESSDRQPLLFYGGAYRNLGD
jgi:flavin reductase (DIM6/NTAB) family NADH-FMN oxidoreductase RutF